MRVMELFEDRAHCLDDAGALHEVAVDLIDTAPGGRVLVHAGVAIGAL
jgi:hydrogenase maturation factor